MKYCLAIAFLLISIFSETSAALEKELSIGYESPVLAQRGETQITHLDFDARLLDIPEQDRSGFVSDPARIEEIINQLLFTQSMVDQAETEGLLDDPLVQADLYRTVANRVAEIYRERVIEQQALSDYTNAAREIYILNPERFEQEESVNFSHILISSDNADAEERAEEIFVRIQAGERIENIAAEVSDDPSVAQNNGMFEAIPVSRLEERFRAGISTIEEKDTGLIESGFGWHIVRLDQRIPPRRLEFDEVSQELIEQAKEQHRGEIIERMLRAHYAQDLQIPEGAIAELLNRHSAQATLEMP